MQGQSTYGNIVGRGLGPAAKGFSWRRSLFLSSASHSLGTFPLGGRYWADVVIGPGANYLFMARPEDTPSILDILPPNFALRLVVMAGVITLMFFLAYLPWYLKDRKAKKAEKASPGTRRLSDGQ